jgi:hypothetical protein
MEVPLEKHIDRLLAEADRRYEQRFLANDIALSKAEAALRDYKLGSNEWRDALKDANHRMATRLELEKVELAVRHLETAKANFEGRIAVFSAVVSGMVSLLVWLASRLM